ncbi:hypothetical protein VB774_07115 [Pseudanabaena galeata UHCC 0370]|uniref:Transposase n=1 Tax=Pseudanabaena galeata UHCC 0370 TaxID=3110310 RepID=A0ABU5TGY2_9CYAN|nr:hypothetical protein [Pseudanabaena galeata]MEA5477387.1 hypothetical protein [Pseudanabaena galeata UHCC 0370]
MPSFANKDFSVLSHDKNALHIFATTIWTALQTALSLELSTRINWLTSEYLGEMWIVPPNMS